MSAEDEIHRGMRAGETQAGWRAEAQRVEAATSADRRRRAAEIRAAITTFLGLMRRHGNPGAVRILGSSPNDRPKQSFLQSLFSQPAAAPTEVLGWQVSETLQSAEASAYLVVTVEGELFRAHSESEGGWNQATGRWGPTVWVREAPFTLGAHDDIDERLEQAILYGIGKIIHADGLSWPGS